MSNTMFETYDDPKNFHHWTTRYVWNTFIPTLLKHLDIDVDLTKFTYVERIIDGLDVSFHELQNDQTFNAVNLTTREHFDGKDHRRILRLGDGENIKDGTPYHKTFRFAHQTGIIKNDKPLIDKKILMTCDSMGIPIAPFLAYVFREVFVRDFRFGVKCRELIKEFKPDYFISIYLTNDYRSNLSIMNGLM